MVDVFVNPVPVDNTAASTISVVESTALSGIATAQSFARSAVAEATAFLGALQAAINSVTTIPSINTSLGPIGATVNSYVAPALPVEPTGLNFVAPAAPTPFVATPVATLTVAEPPEFTDAPQAIAIPTKPAAFTGAAPLVPTLAAVPMPVAPPVPLPALPSLLGITVPVTPLLTLPTFTAATPSTPAVAANTFGFNETAYTSTLLTNLRSVLLQWVDGTFTGLDPAVEAAIWQRGRDREVVAANRKITEVTRNFARNGFTKPPGMLALEIEQALQSSQDTQVTASREVMVKQADLEQSNRRFAFEQAWKVEEGLVQYQGQIAARTLEAAKFVQQVAVDIYRELVAQYGHEVQALAAQVEVFKARLQAELSKLEIFRQEIEAQRLIGTINEQSVSIYREQVAALRTVIELFAAEVAAANAQAQVNKTLIEGYAAQVGAFDSLVRANATAFQAYATEMQGEQIKAEIFKVQAEAYNSRTTGYRAGVDAKVAVKEIEIKTQQLGLDTYKTGAEVFRTLTDAEAARVGAGNKTYEVRAQVYDAATRGEGVRVTSEVEHFKADVSVAVAQSNVIIEVLKANLQALIQQVTLLVEAAKGGAQVSAQMASSALAGFNMSVGLHGQGSASTSYGASNSYTGSAQVSASDQTINQTLTTIKP